MWSYIEIFRNCNLYFKFKFQVLSYVKKVIYWGTDDLYLVELACNVNNLNLNIKKKRAGHVKIMFTKAICEMQ